MSHGAGRGRAWLNLAKNSEPPRPGGPLPSVNGFVEDYRISEDNKELIERVKLLNSNDDGIAFNNKMKHIQNFWIERCHCKEDVENSFEELYNAALHNSELGSKVVSLLSSHTFVKQYIHDFNFRYKFLQRLQDDYENRIQLKNSNPITLRNLVHIMGDFFRKGKLENGRPYIILGTPLISCLELLLDTKSIADLNVFTTQIYLNGSSLKTNNPDELTKLAVKIRSVLSLESQLEKEVKLWLLLTLDLFSVKFGILSADVYKFYEEHLGPTVMINFQCPQDLLSIQTISASKVLDSYQSNVNVLQISTSPPDGSDTAEVSFKKKENPGRPILGAGARFIKNKSEENSTNKFPSSGRSQKKVPFKGWEHDDRFENDYS